MNSLKILYVDDEPDIREIAALSLGLDPLVEVREAASGAAALELLSKEEWAPDLILLDVMMPGMDGPEALGRLRDIPGQKRTPVIFITARAQAHEQARYMSLGALGVITKPFDPMSLAAEVRGLLSRKAA